MNLGYGSILFPAIVLMLLQACSKDPGAGCINSSGPVTEETRQITAFKYLRVSDDISVNWHDSSETFLKLKCGKNLMPGIITKSEGNELIIENQNRCNWVRSYKLPMEIELYSPAPWMIRLDGFGEFRCIDSLNAGLMTLQLYGSGKSFIKMAGGILYCDFSALENAEISGYADYGIFAIQNTGKLDASRLRMRSIEVDMKGENDASIYSTDSLRGKHNSPRSLFLKGSPHESVQFLNSGKLVAF